MKGTCFLEAGGGLGSPGRGLGGGGGTLGRGGGGGNLGPEKGFTGRWGCICTLGGWLGLG